MPNLTIRQLDERTKRRLRLRAAQHGHSMEQEARLILAQALDDDAAEEDGAAWVRSVLQRFEAVASDDWAPPERSSAPARALPGFEA